MVGGMTSPACSDYRASSSGRGQNNVTQGSSTIRTPYRDGQITAQGKENSCESGYSRMFECILRSQTPCFHRAVYDASYDSFANKKLTATIISFHKVISDLQI